MKNYIVTFEVRHNIRASSPDHALLIAKDKHEHALDGEWEVMIDPYDSNNYTTLGEDNE